MIDEMPDNPQVLIPYDRREAITLRQAALIAGRSESTLRSWCQTHQIGRRVGGGHWMISRPALQMFLDDDAMALRAYLKGDRESDLVLAYFLRVGVPTPIGAAKPLVALSTENVGSRKR